MVRSRLYGQARALGSSLLLLSLAACHRPLSEGEHAGGAEDPSAEDDAASESQSAGGSGSGDSDTGDSDAGTSDPPNPSTGDPTTSGAPDDSEGSGDGDDFVMESDLPPPPAGLCDPYEPDCQGGFKCVPFYDYNDYGWGHKCVPVSGTQPVGEPCQSSGHEEALDNCDAHGACFLLNDNNEGTCLPFCVGSVGDPECPSWSYCPIAQSPTPAVCYPACHPLAKGHCPEEYGCYPMGSYQGYFGCTWLSDNLPEGAVCEWANQCEPGNLCAPTELLPACDGLQCCTAFCDVLIGQPGCALEGTECVAYFDPQQNAPPEYDNLGICIVPE